MGADGKGERGAGGQLQEKPHGAGGGGCEGSPKKPQGAHDEPPVAMQRNRSRKRHVHGRNASGRVLPRALRNAPLTGHARRSETTAIWLSQRSTFHV